LGSGRKPEYPERTHTYTGRTCKLHTERPQPKTLEPSCCEVTVLTTTPPCSLKAVIFSKIYTHKNDLTNKKKYVKERKAVLSLTERQLKRV